MKNINTKYFMMLTLLAVGSMNLQAMDYEDVELQSRHEDSTFLGQMHHMQNEMSNVRHDVRNRSKMASNQTLDRVAMEIDALESAPEFRDENMRETHIATLRRELKHARNVVKHHGMENGSEVRIQGSGSDSATWSK